MKSFKIILAVISLLVCGLFFLVFCQFRQCAAARTETDEKKAIVEETLEYKKKSEILEKELVQLQDKLDKMDRKVFSQSAAPMTLFEELSLSANKNNLKHFTFSYVGQKQPVSETEKKVKKKKKPKKKKKSRNPAPAESGAAKIIPLSFILECEGEYSDLVLFLQDLYSLERIVFLEKIEISRDLSLLPRQKIILTMSAYSFAQ